MEKYGVVGESEGDGGGGVVFIDPFTRLAKEKPLSYPAPAPASRTLLDIIRDEDPNSKILGHKEDRKSWKLLFRDGLRIKRVTAAWTNLAGRDLKTHLKDSVSTKNKGQRLQSTRRSSCRISSSESSQNPSELTHHEKCTSCGGGGDRPLLVHVQFSRQNSTDENSITEVAREGTRRLALSLARERTTSKRHAVASREEASRKAQADQQPVAPRASSLMELFLSEETDRQMGVKEEYILSDDSDEEEEEEYEDCNEEEGGEEEEEEEEEEEFEECGNEEEEGGENVKGEIEKKCCVCMARHRGAAFIPCGHTFCRLCSTEVRAKRGNCPLCNSSILEILYIF